MSLYDCAVEMRNTNSWSVGRRGSRVSWELRWLDQLWRRWLITDTRIAHMPVQTMLGGPFLQLWQYALA